MDKYRDDDGIGNNDFTQKIFTQLKSRLHARFIQYEVFTFNEKHASVTLSLTNTNVTVRLPFMISATKDSSVYVIMFRSKEISGSLSSVISYLMTTMRREETKLSKFKKAT